MAHRQPLPTWQAAILLVLAFRALGAKKASQTSRAKFSRRTLAKLSRRSIIRDAFIDELRTELAYRGFVLLERRDGFALIDEDSVDSWATMTSKLLGDSMNEVRYGRFDFDRADESLRDSADDEVDEAA